MSDDIQTQLGELIAGRIRDVPDFPQPGIQFKDITPLLVDPAAFRVVVRALADVAPDVDLVAGVEARGFLFAGALACELDCGLVPVRKVGKLPPPTLRRAYELEYGTAEIEVPVDVLDGARVLLVDDVLATGGTMLASAELIGEAGGTVAAMAVVLELSFLAGRDVLAPLGIELAALLTV